VLNLWQFFYRTKALVLELLAAICLVKGGHEIILSAFDNFKEVCHETQRFHTLMEYFINYQVFHIEFMVTTSSSMFEKLTFLWLCMTSSFCKDIVLQACL
jgi:hypothetical protein